MIFGCSVLLNREIAELHPDTGGKRSLTRSPETAGQTRRLGNHNCLYVMSL